MTPNDRHAQEIRKLRETIEDLKEEIRARNAAFGPPGLFPYELGLTHSEDVTLSALFNRYPGTCDVDALILRVHGLGASASNEVMGALVRRVRAKVQAFGVEILADMKSGFRLSEAGYEALSTLQERAANRGKRGGLPAGRQRFSEAEDAALTERWLKGTPTHLIRAELQELGFPERFPEAYPTRAARLGHPRRSPDRWSQEADEIVRAGYKAGHKPPKIRKALNRAGFVRSLQAVGRRIDYLEIAGSRARRLSAREKEIMQSGFDNQIPVPQIRETLAREGYIRTNEVIYSRRRSYLGNMRAATKRTRPVPGWQPPSEFREAAE